MPCVVFVIGLVSGAYITEVPTITGKIAIKDEAELCKEWKRAQALTDKPVKYTFPGPMTILDGMIDTFYGSEQRQELVDDLVACINTGMRALQAAGCKGMGE
jgi:5-methyltetrahydropteroyltriglutamate--homocysteine methyltransferase